MFSLPRAKDLTNKFPTPGRQSPQKNCGAWAIGYALRSGQEVIRKGWTPNTVTHNFSPSYIYNQVQIGNDGGAYTEDILDLCINQGVCSLQYFPYVPSDHTTQPTLLQREAASLHKAVSKVRLDNVLAMKTRINNNDGVILSFYCYPNFETLSSTNPVYNTFNSNLPLPNAGHAVCLIGYDDSRYGGAFKAINSWGTSWGDNGYFWITYDMVNDSRVNMNGAGRAWALNAKSTSTESYCLGDVTGDSRVPAVDARKVLRFSARLETLTARQQALADVDGNAIINEVDARNILKFVARTITVFPVNQ